MDIPTPVARRSMTQLALKAFFDLANQWKLSRAEAMTLLGLTATSTYANWKNGKTTTIPRDTLERISYLLNISDSLTLLQGDGHNAVSWLKQPHSEPTFSEQSPFDLMLKGNVANIYMVHQCVESLRTSQTC